MEQVLKGGRYLAVDAGAARRIIAAGDADASLLYLYILENGGAFSAEGAAGAIKWPAKRVEAAFARLSSMGLVSGTGKESAAAPLEPADEPPAYDINDIKTRCRSDGEFAPLVTEVQRLMGRVLSGADLITLFGIYDHLALPPEVIILLVSHCLEELGQKYGEGRRLSMRTVEKTAYVWARRELCTLALAEDYLLRRAGMRSEAARVKSALGIRDRRLSPTEERFINSWLELGYEADALELAYDRTVVKTGALNWKYMDSIVRSWDAKGLKTPAEIEARDGATRPAAKPAETADDLELLRKQLGMK